MSFCDGINFSTLIKQQPKKIKIYKQSIIQKNHWNSTHSLLRPFMLSLSNKIFYDLLTFFQPGTFSELQWSVWWQSRFSLIWKLTARFEKIHWKLNFTFVQNLQLPILNWNSKNEKKNKIERWFIGFSCILKSPWSLFPKCPMLENFLGNDPPFFYKLISHFRSTCIA